jgi:hypothetical protein
MRFWNALVPAAPRFEKHPETATPERIKNKIFHQRANKEWEAA